MIRLANHARRHVIAYVALGCSLLSLGGASYAALQLPAGSVGARQLKNRSISAVKFNPNSIAGSVRHWVHVDAQQAIVASSSPAQIIVGLAFERIAWGDRLPSQCLPIVTVERPLVVGAPFSGFADATITSLGSTGSAVAVTTYNTQGQPAAEPFYLAVICP